ncbi:MAG: ExeA family protein [Syntrophales bacterium]
MMETTAETLTETKYYEYWGLFRPPFDNVPDPSMYVDCHASMESAVAETLFAIEEGDECISVIVGDVGLGKTLTIRLIIDLLEPEKYKIALITNPGITFIQILQEIIGQLQGKQCEEKRKVNLLETFNKLLFSTLEEGKKILIFVDECNAMSTENLEHLRLLTNMQGDVRNLFTLVLAGQLEFAKRLEHPSRANLFQRIGTYCKITRFDSTDVVRKYVESRLKLAGAGKQIFSDDAFGTIYKNSDVGVPRLINKLCKLCLKAGETNNLSSISAEVVEQISSRFNKMTRPNVQRRFPPQVTGRGPSTAAKEPNGPAAVRSFERTGAEEDQEPRREASFLPPEELPEQQAEEYVEESIGTAEPQQEASFLAPEETSEQQAEEHVEESVGTAEPQREASFQPPDETPGQQAEEGYVDEPVGTAEPQREASFLPAEEATQRSGEKPFPAVGAAENVVSFLRQERVSKDEVVRDVSTATDGETVFPLGEEDCSAKQEGTTARQPAAALAGDSSSFRRAESVAAERIRDDGGDSNGVGSASPFMAERGPRTGEPSERHPQAETDEGPSVDARETIAAGGADTDARARAVRERVTMIQERLASRAENAIPEKQANANANSPGELEIHGCKIMIEFPADLLERSKSSTAEYRAKMAGMVAAETLKRNSHIITSYTVDPVPIWQEIRDYVLNRFNQAGVRGM